MVESWVYCGDTEKYDSNNYKNTDLTEIFKNLIKFILNHCCKLQFFSKGQTNLIPEGIKTLDIKAIVSCPEVMELKKINLNKLK